MDIKAALAKLTEYGPVVLECNPWPWNDLVQYTVSLHGKVIGSDTNLTLAMAAALATLFGKE